MHSSPYFSPARNKYKATIRIGGSQRLTLGWYSTALEADQAYLQACHELRDTGTVVKHPGQRYEIKR